MRASLDVQPGLARKSIAVGLLMIAGGILASCGKSTTVIPIQITKTPIQTTTPAPVYTRSVTITPSATQTQVLPTATLTLEPSPTAIPNPTGVPNSMLPQDLDYLQALLEACKEEAENGDAQLRVVDYLPGATDDLFRESIGADCYNSFPGIDPGEAAWGLKGMLNGWPADEKGYYFLPEATPPGNYLVFVKSGSGGGAETGSMQFFEIGKMRSLDDLVVHQPPWIPQGEFILLDYNIFYGAGQHPECQSLRHIENKDVGRTYAPEKAFYQLIEVVNAANPDNLEYLVALTEACLFNELNVGEGTTQLIKDKFAHATSLKSCYIGKDYISGNAPAGVCTTYQIVGGKSLQYTKIVDGPEDIFRGVRVLLRTPEDKNIVVYVVHFTPFDTLDDPVMVKAQAKWVSGLIAQDMRDNPGYLYIMTGDFNAHYTPVEPILEEIGLRPMDYENNSVWFILRPDYRSQGFKEPIDQIWFSSGFGFGPYAGDPLMAVKDTAHQVSNHAPEIVKGYILPNP